MGVFLEEKRETCMKTTCFNPGINSWEDTHTHRLQLWPRSQFSPTFFKLDCSLARCAHSTWTTKRVHLNWLWVRRGSTSINTKVCWNPVGIQDEPKSSLAHFSFTTLLLLWRCWCCCLHEHISQYTSSYAIFNFWNSEKVNVKIKAKEENTVGKRHWQL